MERRSNSYTFSTKEELIRFFMHWMDRKSIKEVLKQANDNFITREDASREDSQLQYLRKSETELFRVLKSETMVRT